tara:strand:+ start:717 stop:1388 length:672 start_codon:yes stop_codon:yes gene_type:complete
MNILNHFELPYCENNTTVIASTAGGGKSSVLESLILEHMQKGFNCLYVGEVSSSYFFNRIKRKKEQCAYKKNENNGSLFYLSNDNFNLIQKFVNHNKIQSIFFDDYVGYQQNILKHSKRLLTEKTIERKFSVTNRDTIMENMGSIRDISNVCDVSCYISTGLQKSFRYDSGTEIFHPIDNTLIWSDVYMTVNKTTNVDNGFNAKISLIKNRYGCDNLSLQTQL